MVLPPLGLGSPMVHVSIHGSSVARVDLGKDGFRLNPADIYSLSNHLAPIALWVILRRIHLAHLEREGDDSDTLTRWTLLYI